MVELTTKSGYQVQFKDELDTNGYRAIQAVTLKQLRLHSGMSQDDVSVGGDAALEAEDVALRHMLISVMLPDKTLSPDPVAAVGTMPFKDGEAVYAKVNELTSDSGEDDAKKESPASPST